MKVCQQAEYFSQVGLCQQHSSKSIVCSTFWLCLKPNSLFEHFQNTFARALLSAINTNPHNFKLSKGNCIETQSIIHCQFLWRFLYFDPMIRLYHWRHIRIHMWRQWVISYQLFLDSQNLLDWNTSSSTSFETLSNYWTCGPKWSKIKIQTLSSRHKSLFLHFTLDRVPVRRCHLVFYFTYQLT